jgi:8-oxo-dGTP pyrophosphatase MutT (NUDIX family)
MPIPDFVADLRRHIGSTPLWLIGCTAVVIRDRGSGSEMLTVRRADNGAWTPVTGIVDPGEHPELAAVRETLEETTIVAEVTRLAQVSVTPMMTYPNGDRTQYLDLTYRCRYLSGEPFPDDGENTEARWIPVAELDTLDPPITPHMRARIDAALATEQQPRTVLLEHD